MRNIMLVVALISSCAELAGAQAPVAIPGAGARMGNEGQVVEYLMSTAFKDIALTPAQKDSVRSLTHASLEQQRGLDFGAPDMAERRLAILDKRNAGFRALLKTDKDRATFDLNIKTRVARP